MKPINFFEKFDQHTQLKLTIFTKYIEAWLPTFVTSNFEDIYIYDFFAGVGKDGQGVIGSPLIILKAILDQQKIILRAGCNVHIHFNDKTPDVFEQLKVNCLDCFSEFPEHLQDKVNMTFSSEDFEKVYPKVIDKLKSMRFTPSLFLVDPFGIFPFQAYLNQVLSLSFNDFILFMPSHQIRRFYEQPSFREKLPSLSLDGLEPFEIHQIIVEQLASFCITPDSEFNLLPFTIQKGSNYFGITFGAKHLRAFDKFLDIAWELDPKYGNANFSLNIENKRTGPAQHDLFAPKVLTKKEAFSQLLSEKVLSGKITNNYQAYEFSIRNAHPVKHTHDVLVSLKNKKQINYSGRSPKVRYSYYKARKSPKQASDLVEYKILE